MVCTCSAAWCLVCRARAVQGLEAEQHGTAWPQCLRRSHRRWLRQMLRLHQQQRRLKRSSIRQRSAQRRGHPSSGLRSRGEQAPKCRKSRRIVDRGVVNTGVFRAVMAVLSEQCLESSTDDAPPRLAKTSLTVPRQPRCALLAAGGASLFLLSCCLFVDTAADSRT